MTTLRLISIITALAFLAGMLHFRITSGFSASGDLVFRIVMLVYFIAVGVKLIPWFANWAGRQDFMQEGRDTTSEQAKKIGEIVLLVASGTMVISGTVALLTGTMPEMDRYGSSDEYNSMSQTAEYWSNVLVGFMLIVFCVSAYLVIRDQNRS